MPDSAHAGVPRVNWLTPAHVHLQATVRAVGSAATSVISRSALRSARPHLSADGSLR